MARWEPDARGRMVAAAVDLYLERGYEQTTVADIAGAAGVTERTFFRHFADKREVLFSGSEVLQAAALDAVAQAPTDASPVDLATVAVEAACVVMADRTWSRRRAAALAAAPPLMERELLKLSRLTATIADALRERGVADPAAAVAAETAVGMFRLGFERWIASDTEESAADHVRSAFADLRALT